jgi:hypothetical protein
MLASIERRSNGRDFLCFGAPDVPRKTRGEVCVEPVGDRPRRLRVTALGYIVAPHQITMDNGAMEVQSAMPMDLIVFVDDLCKRRERRRKTVFHFISGTAKIARARAGLVQKH